MGRHSLIQKRLTNNLLKNAVVDWPILLILDGHGSHYQPELIVYAKKNGVVLFCLPLHATHESQPLDTSVFKPLKQNSQNACIVFVQANPGKVIIKYTFSALNRAWSKTMGFKRSGIYPFNPKAIDYGVNVDITKKPTSKKDDSKSKSKDSKGDDFNSRSKNLQLYFS